MPLELKHSPLEPTTTTIHTIKTAETQDYEKEKHTTTPTQPRQDPSHRLQRQLFRNKVDEYMRHVQGHELGEEIVCVGVKVVEKPCYREVCGF